VTRDVPPHTVAVGAPAQVIKEITLEATDRTAQPKQMVYL
jgi:acetyltransferase-like isoleucine patch superfamily enzyme